MRSLAGETSYTVIRKWIDSRIIPSDSRHLG
jgi:hypothetical protein